MARKTCCLAPEFSQVHLYLLLSNSSPIETGTKTAFLSLWDPPQRPKLFFIQFHRSILRQIEIALNAVFSLSLSLSLSPTLFDELPGIFSAFSSVHFSGENIPSSPFFVRFL